MPEFVKARIALVLVGGSVEDERTFSTVNFILSELRSKLGEDNLNHLMAIYMAKRRYTLATFPIRRAYDAWRAARARRGASHTVEAEAEQS
jgi:hypothetical protein